MNRRLIFSAIVSALIMSSGVSADGGTVCSALGRTSKTINGLDLELNYLHDVELDVDVIDAVLSAAENAVEVADRLSATPEKKGPAAISGKIATEGALLKKAAISWSHDAMLDSISRLGQSLEQAVKACRK